jgi:hypothetical protein
LGEWAAARGSGGGQLVAVDLLVFIRMLIFFTADFGCVTKKSRAPKIKQESTTGVLTIDALNSVSVP